MVVREEENSGSQRMKWSREEENSGSQRIVEQGRGK